MSRFEKAFEKALDAFWSEFTDHYPVESEDVPSGIRKQLEGSVRQVMETKEEPSSRAELEGSVQSYENPFEPAASFSSFPSQE